MSDRPDHRRDRTLTSYHEASHAITALACNHYRVLDVELTTNDRDISGVSRQIRSRQFEQEQPYQKLEIAVGGFIVVTSGWLAECKAAAVCGWLEERYNNDCFMGDDGEPDWARFKKPHDTDYQKALDNLSKAAAVLGSKTPTETLVRELKTAAWWTVRHCWAGIEDLARELDRSGRVECISNYWPDGCTGKVPEVCARLALKHRRCDPNVRDYVPIWKACPKPPLLPN
ncbi:MAG: hypothetical protein WCO60_18695 [Verrucomicrobiota bacterium]